ncbi:MAG: hypothetical protein JNL36_05535 [Candidatus Kapabacteria bacterium]|nr:hypothetical protein [Candidatus Kapabacteria bacterium]
MGLSCIRILFPLKLIPSIPIVVVTIGVDAAKASKILIRMPLPLNNGTTITEYV